MPKRSTWSSRGSASSRRSRTTIVISHRFPTVRMARQITRLDHGSIAEAGTHDALVARGNEEYARMFALQAEGYR